MIKSHLIFCRIIAVLMVFVSAFSVNAVVNAQEKNDDIVLPQYITILDNSTCISINGIKATCAASVTSKQSTSLKIKMELQKKKSNGYETIETWTKSKNAAKRCGIYLYL